MTFLELLHQLESQFAEVLVRAPSSRIQAPEQAKLLDLAFNRARSQLRADEDSYHRLKFETQLRWALHLSPREAISYDTSNPVPRWILIERHLCAAFPHFKNSEGLARGLSDILDSWCRERTAVGKYLGHLLSRQDNCCANCRVSFQAAPTTLSMIDEFKPYHHSPEELLSPEVDHIEAVSCLGNNNLENLQVLCRLCNAGKGDGLGIDVRSEAKYAGSSPASVPTFHRAALLYHVIERDRRKCSNCNSESSELTIRLAHSEGAFVRSNLVTLCVDCVNWP